MKNSSKLIKNTLFLSFSVILASCAHERTEIDRELALKLVDKAGRIEIVQTNNGNPSQNLINPSQPQAQHGPWERYQSPQQAQQPSQYDLTSHTCRTQPILSLEGRFLRTDVECY
jgi:hypothetical protein